jgi:hypothetical protein
MGILETQKQKVIGKLKKAAITVNEVVAAATSENTLAVLRAMNQIWTRQTLLELMSGQVVVQDVVVNAYLNKESKRFKRIHVITMVGQSLRIEAVTTQGTAVHLSTRIKSLVHNSMQSRLVVEIEKLSLPQREIVSWLLQYTSAGFLTKFFPTMDGDGINVSFDGDLVTIDFREKLHSEIQLRCGVIGETLLDHMEIFGVTTGAGESAFKVKLKGQ